MKKKICTLLLALVITCLFYACQDESTKKIESPQINNDVSSIAAENAQITPSKANKRIKPCKIAICCVFKNEAMWLREWIEFHRLMGVEHFYLYNNLSTDSYKKVLSAYIEKGIVSLYDFPKFPFNSADQITAYNHALKLSKEKNKWLAIIDADEFITPLTHNNLKEYLNNHDATAAFYLKWQLFGTSGVQRLQADELMVEKLVLKSPTGDGLNVLGKSIVQPLLTIYAINPHNCALRNEAVTAYPKVAEIRINHYFVRTADYFYATELEKLRQRNNQNLFSPESMLEYLPIANAVKDDSMQRFLAALKVRMFND